MKLRASASQIKKFRQCERLYGFEYVEKIKPPPNVKQRFGTAVHKQLENWFRHGQVPDNSPEGQTAKQGIKSEYLPPPTSDILVEHHFSFDFFKDVSVAGYIDVASEADGLVIDHKSTSDLRYAMTEEELKVDPQALIYAIWAMLEWNQSAVRARWVYYAASNPTNGPRKPKGAHKVDTVFYCRNPHFRGQVSELASDLVRMRQIRTKELGGLDLPPTPGSCGDFGGCPHSDRCNLEPEDRLAAYLDGEEKRSAFK